MSDGQVGLTVMAALRALLHDAEADLLEVRHIRVTTAAIAGSLVTVPFSPERLRVLAGEVMCHRAGAAPWLEHVAVIPDLAAFEYWREIPMHPSDWLRVLRDEQPADLRAFGEPLRLWGVPVDPGARVAT